VEDEAPEVDEENEPITKLGDIWQLGRHRLMCGDSTDKETVELLMNGNKADMVFTDPPYGMKIEADGVLNDNLNYDDLLEFNKKWIPLTFANTKENGSWYCWGIDEPLMDIYSHILKPMIKSNKCVFRNLITWFKNPSGCGDGQNNPLARSYGIITEKCLFVMCGVQGFSNNSDNYFEEYEPIRKYLEEEAHKVCLNGNKLKEICGVGMYAHWFTKSQWDLMKEEHYTKLQNYYKGQAFEKPYEKIKQEYEKIKQEWYETRAYFNNTHDLMTEVWQFDRTTGEERKLTGGHATPKPIALCSRAIKSSSRENESVLDVFGGSGSTLIACEQLDRTCYMMELDPKYCDVIIKRWETLTGEKAVLING
jgi:DNA modification methylase